MSPLTITEFESEEFQKILEVKYHGKYPFECALQLLYDDEVVLNRCMMAYYLQSKSIGDKEEKFKELQLLSTMLSNAINENPDVTLLARALRMNVFYDMSRSERVADDPSKQKELLLKAKHEGIASFQENMLAYDACKLVDICLTLAKFPNVCLNGQSAIVNNEYLTEAFDILNKCFYRIGSNFYYALKFGEVFFRSGEIRKATEWAKTAFFLSDPDLPYLSIQKIQCYLLEQDESTMKYRELSVILGYVLSLPDQVSNVNGIVSKLVKETAPDKLFSFINYLHNTHLTHETITLSAILKKSMIRERLRGMPKEVLEKITFTQADEVPLVYDEIQQDEYTTPDNNIQYDYCLITGKDHFEWIQCFLYHQLEEQLFDDDESFKGLLKEIDFSTVSSIVHNFLTTTKESRKTILVISDQFVEREWPVLKPYIIEMMNDSTDVFRMVILKHCRPPTELEHVLSFDFSELKRIPSEILNLKLSLVEVCKVTVPKVNYE